MKTIEERAKAFAQNFNVVSRDMDCGTCNTCTKCKEYNRFVDIVTEQRDIDIEKACEAYENELRRLKSLLDKSVGVSASLISVEKSLSKIRKEMVSSIK